MKRIENILLLSVAVAAVTASSVNAQSTTDMWLPLADINVDAYEPESPYRNNLDMDWTIDGPACAESMRIVFRRIDIETDPYYWYDWVQLNNASGVRQQRIDGHAENYTSIAVPGNAIRLAFHSDSSVTMAGYDIERIEVLGCRPCDLASCNPVDSCVEEQVVCVRAPCPPIAVCEPEPSFCATVHCEAGYCDESLRACVDPCADVTCEADQHCEMIQVVCITTPCNPVGMCVADSASEGDVCGADEDCGSGMVCAGIFHAEEGLCGDASSRAIFNGPGDLSIPDNDASGISSEIHVAGLRTVPTDIVVSLQITHTWRGDLRVTLADPSGQEIVLHDRTGSSTDDLVLEGVVVNGFPMDDSVNGVWTLRVTDNAGLDVGTLDSWSLLLGSRFD